MRDGERREETERLTCMHAKVILKKESCPKNQKPQKLHSTEEIQPWCRHASVKSFM